MHIPADVLVEALRSQDLRITEARRAVCEVIAERHSQHLTAATILDAVRVGEEASADESTVYSTLDALEEAGLLLHSHRGYGPAVYHLPTETAHQHVVCNRCGATATIPVDSLANWVATVKESTGFEVDPTHFAITGLCADCAQQR